MSIEDWSILITAEVAEVAEVADDFGDNADADAGDRLAAELDRHNVRATTVSVSPRQIEATVRASAGTIDEALSTVLGVWRKAMSNTGLPDWPVVRADIATYPVRYRESAQPIVPDLVDTESAEEILEHFLGTAEVAELLGVTKPRVASLRQKAEFPRPVAELHAGPVWTAASVEAFARQWKRSVGRPAARNGRLPRSSPLAE